MNKTEGATHGELFAGIGGFGVGANRVGLETKWHVEIDSPCQNILRRHFPDTKVHSDVREVGNENLSYVDIITFGSPCQDLSIAGKRKGLQDGKRSSLFFEAIRIIDELKPAIAVWENVPGVFSSNSGRDFAAVLCAFQGIGARDIAWRILDTQYFGVPQRRRRVFVVADFRGERSSEILFESEGGTGNNTPSRKAGKEVAFTLRTNTASSSGKGDGGIDINLIADTLTGGGNGHRGHSDPVNSTMVVFDRQRSDEYGTSATVSTVAARDYKSASDLITFDWQSGGDVRLNFSDKPMLQASQTPAVWEMSHASEAVRNGGEVVPTLQARMGTGGNQVPMVGVRRLTPTECERLQGFEDGHTAWGIDINGKRIEQSDSARYRQLGNAVAVPVVKWLMSRIACLEI